MTFTVPNIIISTLVFHHYGHMYIHIFGGLMYINHVNNFVADCMSNMIVYKYKICTSHSHPNRPQFMLIAHDFFQIHEQNYFCITLWWRKIESNFDIAAKQCNRVCVKFSIHTEPCGNYSLSLLIVTHLQLWNILKLEGWWWWW